MKKIIILLFIICPLLALPLKAQIKGNNITVTVTPNHKDWNYKTGEKIDYTVCVLKSGTLLDEADISYEMGPEMYPTVKKDLHLKTGTTRISGRMDKPGFHKLKVTAHCR